MLLTGQSASQTTLTVTDAKFFENTIYGMGGDDDLTGGDLRMLFMVVTAETISIHQEAKQFFWGGW